MASSHLSLVIFMAFLIIKPSMAEPRMAIIARKCNDVHVQNISNYFKYYSEAIEYMENEMSRNKFAFREVGKPPDRLYVLAQCMDDVSEDECAVCFSLINTLIPGCFPSTGGRVYLDGCFMRAENYSFFDEALGPQDTKKCSDEEVAKEGEEFRNAVKKVVSSLPREAEIGRGFAMRKETWGGMTAYGMAVCWRTLDSHLCSACLSQATTAALSCLPAEEARVLNTGCFLRYSTNPFANDSSLELDDDIVTYVIYIIGMAAFCLVAIGVGVCLGRLAHKKRHRTIKPQGLAHVKRHRTIKPQGMEEELLISEAYQFLQFKYATLKAATQDFNEAHKLGRGGFGEVYKGTLADGREIAIKRLLIGSNRQIEKICSDMDIIRKAQHKNLVHFLGCCFTALDSFLVYEYLANKSLDLTLFDPEKKKQLDWKKRLSIIIGTAEGLDYLHKDCQLRIIHRDIKASNILLDLKHRPKISDFGLARFCSSKESPTNTAIAGTIGYMAPEYIAKGRLTEKVDVYSYGILVLEIVTGIENTKFQSEDSYETLVTSAWKHFQSKTVAEIVDQSIIIEQMEEVERVVQIGLLCTQESSSSRPAMAEVVQMLTKKELQLPRPSSPPFTSMNMELRSLSSRYSMTNHFETQNS